MGLQKERIYLDTKIRDLLNSEDVMHPSDFAYLHKILLKNGSKINKNRILDFCVRGHFLTSTFELEAEFISNYFKEKRKFCLKINEMIATLNKDAT